MKNSSLDSLIKKNSDKINLHQNRIGLVMAAGHGKRIKSSLPKVAHLVWGKPSVERVLDAIDKGLQTNNQIIVVGRMAEEVMEMIGNKNHRVFAHQEKQQGTGHAVQEGIKLIPSNYQGSLYILPGDAGVIDRETMAFFKKQFERNNCDMMMLTGIYEGEIENNYYGRIVRVPARDINDVPVSKEDQGRVIAIVQYQDIISMGKNDKKIFFHKDRKFAFNKDELYHLREFDAVIFAFNFQSLKKHIHHLSPNNIQKEFYLTDLIEIFNRFGLTVESITPPNHQEVLLGFNDKTVLRKIENIYRNRCFEKIKNFIDIEDSNHFFIDDKIEMQLINKDKKEGPLDIVLGRGAHLTGNITLSKGVKIGQETVCQGNIELRKGVELGSHVHLSNWKNQKIIIEENVQLLGHNIIQGNVTIKKNSLISKSVNITGSDDYPCIIGEHSKIFGSSYLFGSILNSHSHIETSILINKKVNCLKINPQSKKKEILPVKFVIPNPQGEEVVSDL